MKAKLVSTTLHSSVLSALIAFATNATADDLSAGRYCSATATTINQSCGYEVLDDYHKQRAICINMSETAERNECFTGATQARTEGLGLCNEQLANRRAACGLLGEGRYDPEVEPVNFDKNFTNPSNPNPYFPIKIGNKWEYRGAGEAVSVEVLNRTKLIEEITCVVVRDRVLKGGELAEDTDDWFGQARNGDVFYCGEEVKDYESFDGDRPRRPELVSRDGSFKHDRDGDAGGTAFLGRPFRGAAYRQEFSIANAEDMAEVLSTNYRYGVSPALDRNVPQQLANRLCAGDCVVTKEYSLLEPGKVAFKYYARGIGFVFETKSNSDEVLQLINCNFDARCSGLPQVQ
jgi:hypothetical protein